MERMRRIRMQEATRHAEEEQIRPIQETLKRLMSEYTIMPDSRIEPELYKLVHPATNPDDLDRRRKQIEFDEKSKNKLRRAWFTNMLGQIQFAEALLPPLFAHQVEDQRRSWIERVKKNENMTPEMVAEVETFAQDVLKMLGHISHEEGTAIEHVG